jgi:hypothetical protein
MQKPVFIHQVTIIPSEWANAVSNLVYDVFGLANTIADARTRLGLGSIATQHANAINVTGGGLNGVSIGAVQPGVGRFISASVTETVPTHPSMLTTKSYVDQTVLDAIQSLNLREMAFQRSNNVNITGGVATFDTLRCRTQPSLSEDVVTLGYLTTQGIGGIEQAAGVMTVGVDNRTVTTPFIALAGRTVIFVDGLYQLPDQYVILGPHTIQFANVLPVGAVVGGYVG